MSFRSIIDIDVNDEKFADFLSKFDKFKAASKDVPEPFQKMDKKIDAAREGFSNLGAHLKRHMTESASATKGFSLELHHAGKHFATLNARIGRGNKELNQMGETGRKTFGIIARGAKSIFKAIPFIGGAIAGAGLAAVALYQHESNSILNRYKNAKYLGMTPGQVSAIDTQYQGVLANPAQSLAAMRGAEYTPAGLSYFARAIGPGWQKLNQTQLFDAEIRAAKHVADNVDRMHLSPEQRRIMLGVRDQALGFNKIGIGVEDMQLINSTRKKTLNADIANAHRQAAALNFSKQTGRNMTNTAITISQKEVELSTDLSRIMARGAPLMNAALNKIVNSLNWAANSINAALKGMITGKAPTKGGGIVMNTAGKIYNVLHEAHTPKANVAFAKVMMERAEGTSRYAAAKAEYEKEKSEYRSDHQLYHVIKRAVVDGIKESGSGTPAHNMGAQIHMAAH